MFAHHHCFIIVYKALKFIEIIYTESCVFINNCYNKDSFAVFLKIIIYAQIPILTIPDPRVKVFFLFQLSIQQDLKENHFFILQSYVGIIYKIYFMIMTF